MDKKDLQVISINPSFIQRPKTHQEAFELAMLLSKSNEVSECFRGKPYSAFIAIGLGDSLGLSPFQSLQTIMVVKGVASVWGKTTRGLILNHPELEYIKERQIHEVKEKQEACCEIKRKGHEAVIVKFSVEDAKTAKLWQKKGNSGQDTTWITFPWVMLQYKAAHLCEDKAFADVLKGIRRVEEVLHYRNAVETELVDTEPIQDDLMPHKTTEPAPAEEPKAEPTPPDTGERISEENVKELLNWADEHGIPAEEVIDHCVKKYNIQFLAELPKSKIEEVKNWAQS